MYSGLPIHDFESHTVRVIFQSECMDAPNPSREHLEKTEDYSLGESQTVKLAPVYETSDSDQDFPEK